MTTGVKAHWDWSVDKIEANYYLLLKLSIIEILILRLVVNDDDLNARAL